MKRDGDKICSISVILSHHAVSLLRVPMIIEFSMLNGKNLSESFLVSFYR